MIVLQVTRWLGGRDVSLRCIALVSMVRSFRLPPCSNRQSTFVIAKEWEGTQGHRDTGTATDSENLDKPWISTGMFVGKAPKLKYS